MAWRYYGCLRQLWRSAAQPNIQPVLDLLIRYATEDDKRNTTEFLMLGPAGNPKRQANYDWLLKRLKE